jgi:hypothetical protein
VAELEITADDYPPWLVDRPPFSRVSDISPWQLRNLCTKACGRCGEVKRLSEFHRRSTAKDGRHSYCKPCRKGGV